ncbi:MAG: hypothetical protein ACR2QE_06600 [Acidimicrobiales bacterium]
MRPGRLAVLLVVVAGLVTGPVMAAAAQETTDPPATETPATDPPATEAPPADDGATDSGTDSEGGDSDSNSGTIVLVAIIALAAIAIIAAMLFGRRGSSSPKAAAPVARRSTPQTELLGNVRWLHDQLTLELLAAPGAQAQQRWAADRIRVQNMAIEAQQLATGEAAPVWQQVATSIGAVSTSLDTATSLRADPDTDPTLVNEAVAVVNRNRAQLMAAAETAGRYT